MPVKSYSLEKPSFFRRMSMALYDGVRPSHRILGLVEVDVSALRRSLRERRRQGRQADFFAAVVLAVARTLAEFPTFNAMRSGNRVALFEAVDVNVPVFRVEGGEERLATLIIRNAQSLDLAEISRLIEDFKRSPSEAEPERRAFTFLMRLLLALPSVLRGPIVRAFAASPERTRWSFGSTLVTAAGQGTETPGWILPLPTGEIAASFALGSVVRKPKAVGDQIVIREILHLTLSFNHDLVDGSPAARFTRRLVSRLESAEDVT